MQYQNANNSVRVSDEFMRAVEEGRVRPSLARKDGSVIETIDARELMGKIATAAWECADPGIQYDDTINDWHTNPRPAGSPPPTRARVHVARQLLVQPGLAEPAQVPQDDDTFDAAKFQQVAELVITAMDISICFADFPDRGDRCHDA